MWHSTVTYEYYKVNLSMNYDAKFLMKLKSSRNSIALGVYVKQLIF